MKGIICAALLLAIYSCSSNEQPPELSYAEKYKINDSLNNIEYTSLFKKYSAFYNLDSCEYTFQLKHLIDSANGMLGLDGTVSDITIEKSTYHIKIQVWGNDYLANLIIDSVGFEKIKSTILSDTHIYFVCKISTVQSYTPQFKASAATSDQDGEIELDFSHLTVLNGELIDCITEKEIK